MKRTSNYLASESLDDLGLGSNATARRTCISASSKSSQHLDFINIHYGEAKAQDRAV